MVCPEIPLDWYMQPRGCQTGHIHQQPDTNVGIRPLPLSHGSSHCADGNTERRTSNCSHWEAKAWSSFLSSSAFGTECWLIGAGHHFEQSSSSFCALKHEIMLCTIALCAQTIIYFFHLIHTVNVKYTLCLLNSTFIIFTLHNYIPLSSMTCMHIHARMSVNPSS